MAFMNEYEKLRMIGKGSFATIWKVRHIKLGYVRAVKISNEMVADENDPAYLSFLNECKVLLKIGNGSHPNIVHIYQPRLIDNRAIVEMDYVDGETLDQYLSRVRFVPMDEVFRFTDEVVRALAYCHHDIYKFLMDPNEDDLQSDPNDGSKYIIDEATESRLVKKYSVTHNDLHSNNVMRRNYDGSFVLLDFGLAIQDGKAVKSSSRRGGALEYMSPEKFDDSSVISTQSDVYSLGILLYEVLAGRVPFKLDQTSFESNPVVASYEMMTAHKQGVPPSIEPLRREAFEKANPGQTYVKDFPDWLEKVIARCLEKDPARRYHDAKELYDDIQRHKKASGINTAYTPFTSASSSQEPDNNAEMEKNDMEALRNENSRLTTENEDLNSRLEIAGDTNRALKEQNDKLIRRVMDMQNELSVLKEQNSAKRDNRPVKPVERVVYVKKSRVGWIIATFLLLILILCFAAGMVYFIMYPQDASYYTF